MGLTLEQQKAVANRMARRYRQPSKKKKGQIIQTGTTPIVAIMLARYPFHLYALGFIFLSRG